MTPTINFYLDDSGSRYPDNDPGKRAAHGYDWFALGGILVSEEDEQKARDLYAEFCKEWGIKYPLHSVDIRGRTGDFLWLLKAEKPDAEKFYEELYSSCGHALCWD